MLHHCTVANYTKCYNLVYLFTELHPINIEGSLGVTMPYTLVSLFVNVMTMLLENQGQKELGVITAQ